MALESYCLSGIPTKVSKFTWSINRQDVSLIQERLDRVLANPQAMAMFSSFGYQVLPALRSNHCPLSICVSNRTDTPRKTQHLFKFEASQDLHEDCSNIITASWHNFDSNCNGSCGISNRLKSCKEALLKWRSVIKKQEILEQQRNQKLLEQLQSRPNDVLQAEEDQFKKVISQKLDADDLKWK